MLGRFILWLIRIAAIVVFVGAVLLAIFDESHRVAAIVVAVVCFIIASSTAKKGEQKKATSVKKCKKCGNEMSGADYKYRYNLGKASKSPYSGLYKVPVDVTVTCPHCGKEKYLPEVVEICSVTRENVIDAIETKMDNYFNN